MKILLLGEYSRFHNSLKEGLTEMGHKVTLVSDNDFKNYPADIYLYAYWFKDIYILNKIRQGIFRIFKTDVAQWETAVRFYLMRKKFTGYDIVQMVNEYPIQSTPYLEMKMLGYIFKKNKKVFVSSSGDDYICVKYMLSGKPKYSVLTPCKVNPNATHCKYTLKYVTKPFKKLHEFVFENVHAVIPGDMDYALPLQGHPKSTGLVPFPINLKKNAVVEVPSPITSKIMIFHGINKVNYYKKGNDFFEKALDNVKNKYGDRIEVITTWSVPYETYITLYNSCHILLDQIYGYDQGYNALEAMAKGKVVFSGAEDEFMEHYGLTQSERVVVNAIPDVQAIADELSFLIENPSEIVAMGKRARAFVEKEHDHVMIAKKYLEKWGL
ncbi:glycosyltransferase [Flavobacterium sp. MFBS3-15]|uniref:glycosyltransferase n=1 Tax=Flavobacterium sp. MFBS3-15 TaxID=2989816 RepID=UPI00223555F6|nr:glycosyltransferase [Flavobacterium sp. MFBS3-15]MCW4468406.1 glycosyltransferase [Flavobacterium sp. MFBS3-15]